jgi:hypothetical protein
MFLDIDLLFMLESRIISSMCTFVSVQELTFLLSPGLFTRSEVDCA